MERQVTITKLHPYHAEQNTELTLTDAGAQELLIALAEVLGSQISLYWCEPEQDAECGTIAITTTRIATKASEIRFRDDDVHDPSRVEGSHFVTESAPVPCAHQSCPNFPVCDILGDDPHAAMIALEDCLDEDDDLDIPQDCPIL